MDAVVLEDEDDDEEEDEEDVVVRVEHGLVLLPLQFWPDEHMVTFDQVPELHSLYAVLL